MNRVFTGIPVTTPPRPRAGRTPAGWSIAAPLGSILGRETEIQEVLNLLDRDGTRLVTITGPGGIGKTRLAREVALRLQETYAHGACLALLASVRDPRQLPSAVARALGLQPHRDRPADELVTTVLHDRHLLLVLDNLEHLADEAGPWVVSLLERCPRVTVLTTSRLPLRVGGERRFLLGSLSLPDGPDGVPESAAVELFVERARAISPDFTLTGDTAGAVVELCWRLDGLPLAIELAAAQTRLLPPEHLLERIEGRLTELRGAWRDAPPRHETMDAAIAWSHDLLTEEARRLFRWMAVFPGGCSLDGAEAVARAAGVAERGERLLELLEHHLVLRRDGRPDGYRFGMQEVVREFALERFESLNEMDAARDALAAWVQRLGREASGELPGPEQAAALDRLDAERDNLRAAMDWLHERGRVEDAADLAADTIGFRDIRGYNNEFKPYLDALVADPGLAERGIPRAKALLADGDAHLALGHFVDGIALLDEAISIFREHGSKSGVALGLRLEVHALLVMGQRTRGREAGEECIRLGRELGIVSAEIVGLQELGGLAWLQGREEESRAHMERAWQLLQDGGPRGLLAKHLGRMGMREFAFGNYDAAEAHTRESQALCEELGAQAAIPSRLEMLGRVAHLRGDHEAARDLYERAIEAARRVGIFGLANEVELFVGELETDLGRIDAALDTLRRNLRGVDDRSPHGIGASLDHFAELAIVVGDFERAARFIGAADRVYERMGIPRWPGLSTDQRERRVATLLHRLGHRRYEALRAGGGSLSMDEAIDEALAWEPERDAPAQPQDDAELPEGLSPREMEVLKLMADGLTNQEIADTLFVSHRTAAAHSSNIIGKLGVPSRTGAVAYAIRNGLA